MPAPSLESFEIECERRYGGRCAGCGSREYLSARWIVPPEAGGAASLENTVYLCRSCQLPTLRSPGEAEVSVRANVWVSVELHDWVLASGGSALLRELADFYLGASDKALADLPLYQDDPEAPGARLHFRWPALVHRRFADKAASRGRSLTDELASLATLRKLTP